MNFDFVLKKDDLNRQIIFKLKPTLDSNWYCFKEDDNLLNFHSRIKTST